jgi:hypothetical protein
MATRPNREIAQVEAAREDFIGGQKFVGYGQDMLLISILRSQKTARPGAPHFETNL